MNELHRYRDAILVHDDEVNPKRKLIAGAALFPLHDRERHFENNMFYKSLGAVGIGALPFLPTEIAYVRDWLRNLLVQTGWQFADHAVEHRTVSEATHWRWKASEPALIGVLRPEVGHMDWIIKNACTTYRSMDELL